MKIFITALLIAGLMFNTCALAKGGLAVIHQQGKKQGAY